MPKRKQKSLRDHEELEPGQRVFTAVEEFRAVARSILAVAATLWTNKGKNCVFSL